MLTGTTAPGQSLPGIDDNKGVTQYFPKLQNKIFTIKCN